MSELSPIDPTTGNQFNPPADSGGVGVRLGISVEDVRAYRSFIVEQLAINDDDTDGLREHLGSFLERLADKVHSLALGNVDRVQRQVRQLTKNLLELHPREGRDNDELIRALTTRFWSHLHMINRHEAREILGVEHVEFAAEPLASALDELLRAYEDTFALRRPFFLTEFMGDELVKEGRFIGGALESTAWGYLHETRAVLRQSSVLPATVQVQLAAGQTMPLVPGTSARLRGRFHVEDIIRGGR